MDQQKEYGKMDRQVVRGSWAVMINIKQLSQDRLNRNKVGYHILS